MRIVYIGAERVGLACLQQLIQMGKNMVGVFTAHIEQVKALRPDLVTIISRSQTIPKEVLQSARLGCIGIHYSLLPARRGRAPLNWALILRSKASVINVGHRLMII